MKQGESFSVGVSLFCCLDFFPVLNFNIIPLSSELLIIKWLKNIFFLFSFFRSAADFSLWGK